VLAPFAVGVVPPFVPVPVPVVSWPCDPPVPAAVGVLGLPPFVASPGDRYPPPGGVQTIITAGGVVPVGAGSPGAIAAAFEIGAEPPSIAPEPVEPGLATPTPTPIACAAHVHAAGQSEADEQVLSFGWQ